jgi:MoaA/NifB/PqqE/SkfB family radical SAM enzyme
MKLEYADPNKHNWFMVSWILNSKCNYRCSYCPSFLHDGKSPGPDILTAKKFVTNLNQQIPDKTICYRFSGGEPTYWKYFLDLAEHIKSTGNVFSFLSNGSRDIAYFNAIAPLTDGLILSYHKEYADPEHFIKIGQAMNCPVVVNMMVSPENFDNSIAVSKQLYDGGLAVWPKIITDKTGPIITNKAPTFTPEQEQLLKNWPYFRNVDDSKIHRGGMLLDGVPTTANDLIIKGLNKHSGWSCYGGIDQINVDLQGDVYRSDCQVGGVIGTVENFTLPSQPQICNKELCACLSDIYLRKHSD